MAITIKKIDLLKDWVDIKRDELENLGYSTTDLDDETVSVQYFTLKNRSIENKPRNILKSDIFHCPIELSSGLSLLEEKINTGEDLRPHQSRSLKALEKNDGLLFDWNIYHFHLGTTIESDGFINRTGPLAYAFVDDENVYFLDVLAHGAWTNSDLLRILERNWPDTVEKFKVGNGSDYNPSIVYSDNDIAELRQANINTIVNLRDGVGLIGPGGGVAGSGDSTLAVREHLWNMRNFKSYEKKLINETEPELLRIFGNLDFITNEELEFSLKDIGDENAYDIVEKNNDFSIRIMR